MSNRETEQDLLDRSRYPVDEWRLVEARFEPDDMDLTETLFTVANGYLGMRGNPEEGRPSAEHGTFINGFHETWKIKHAESAYGFARTGQTIVNVPDVKLMKIYVDDEPLSLGTSELESYERSIDFRDGIWRRDLVWRTPSGKRVQVTSTRTASMAQRHLVLMTLEVTLLDSDAPVVVSSQVLNREDAEDDYAMARNAESGGGDDPRKSSGFDHRVLEPRYQVLERDRMLLGYQCANSQMTLAVGVDHALDTEDPFEEIPSISSDQAKMVYRVDATRGTTIRIVKSATYHTSRGAPVKELTDRCNRTLDRVRRYGLLHYYAEQRSWYDDFWERSDVTVEGHPALQQAIRFNLFQLAQGTGRADHQGVPAKGVSGSGYEGHYFWDTEIYVLPFLTYTSPWMARNCLNFRHQMLPDARLRAREMAEDGALFPWRTINGEEASAYYAAGTAQVHIDADIAYAMSQYCAASGDEEFLLRQGVEILVETARMYVGLGFWRSNGTDEFHIHGVTGPDEYTTVVNNNLFTNVMARFNLHQAAQVVRELAERDPESYENLATRLSISEGEPDEWERCASGMVIPFDSGLGIHPQDDQFLDREVWDLSRTPKELRPLMLHYHPLVLYRFQVLKQADVVLALFLAGDAFSAEEKRADFEYYDPITTGDSTLSAVVQSVMAAEVGYHDLAEEYFRHALFVDLANLHGNSSDGLHIASCGGVWGALAFGFGGMRDQRGKLSFDPRLPEDWELLTFRIAWHGTRLRVEVGEDRISFTPEEFGGPVALSVRGTEYEVGEEPLVVELDGHGPRIEGEISREPLEGVRADGSRLTSGVPSSIHVRDVVGGPDPL